MSLVLCRHLANRCKSTQSGLKVLFFGTDDFSLPTLQALHRETLKEEDEGCVRSLSVCCTKMKHLVSKVSAFSSSHPETHFPAYPPEPEDLSGFDIGVVASFGHLIPSKIISSFPRGVLNVHGSLLPRWRGAAPIAHAIANGDTRTGVSIMEIAPKKFDIGAVLAQQSIQIEPDEFHCQLSHKMAQIGADLMIRVLRDLDKYDREKVLQDDSQATSGNLLDFLWQG